MEYFKTTFVSEPPVLLDSSPNTLVFLMMSLLMLKIIFLIF